MKKFTLKRLQADLIVENLVMVELKSVRIAPIQKAIATYLRLSDSIFLINFNVTTSNGISASLT